MRELRRMRKCLSGVLFIVLFAFLPSMALAAWTIEDVDAPKYFSDIYPRAIALDSSDRPHIAYGGDHLYHAYFDGIQWQYEVADNAGGVGRFVSIAVDLNDKVHISYYDSTNNSLKYATNASGSWVTQVIDSGGNVGYSSLAVDSNNKVHISYTGSNIDLKYATNASGSWVTQTVDSAVNSGYDPSIAIDSNNKAHISYCRTWYQNGYNYDLKYATNASGSWVTQTIDTSTGDGVDETSIAIDLNNKVHISYWNENNYYLKYATNASGSWVIQPVDSVGWYPSIAVDSKNYVYISYQDRHHFTLKYATNASGSWVTQTIDSAGNVGTSTSTALDSSGKVHISYLDSKYDLKYATNASGSWVTQTIDSSGYGAEGEYTSIAVDSNNSVHIGFYGATYYDLKYATNASG